MQGSTLTLSGTLQGSPINVSNLNFTGTPSATTYARGDGTWATVAGGGAPTTSKYLLQQADASLPNAQAVNALATGIVKVTTGTGVLSTAAAGTDYGPPTSGNATGLVVSTTATGAHTAYAGATCTAQFARSLNASGAATCASVDLSADTAATVLPMTKGGTGANLTGVVGGVHYSSSTTATTQTAGGAQGSVLYNSAANTPAWIPVGTARQSLHGGATVPVYAWSPDQAMLAATWATSATANTTGIVGTGGVPMTSPAYPASGAAVAFRCVISMARQATTNGPRYGVAASAGSVSRISFTARVGLAATTETITRLTAGMTANCAANCSTALTVGTVAQVMEDVIEGTAVTSAVNTALSLYAAPSAAAACTAQVGSYCQWY